MKGAASLGALIATLVSAFDTEPQHGRRRFSLPATPLRSDAIDPKTVSPRPWRTWPGCQTRAQRRAGRAA